MYATDFFTPNSNKKWGVHNTNLKSGCYIATMVCFSLFVLANIKQGDIYGGRFCRNSDRKFFPWVHSVKMKSMRWNQIILPLGNNSSSPFPVDKLA